MDDASRILVLEAALDRARTELTALESGDPRDEAAIAQKKGAIEAVTQTLASTKRRLHERENMRPSP
jgi:hypothetical protein